MKKEDKSWISDQDLIKKAIKIGKELFPNGCNKLQLCAIGKRIHEELDISISLIEQDVIAIKSRQQANKDKEKQQNIKEANIERNNFNFSLDQKEGYVEVVAYDLEQFFRLVEKELCCRIEKQRDESPRNVVGGYEDEYFMYNGIKYYGHLSAFWEKSFWYDIVIKDSDEIEVFKESRF